MNQFDTCDNDTYSKIYKLLNCNENGLNNSILYVSKDNNILWRNKHAITCYKQDPKGKTAFDLFSKESARICFEDNQWIIHSNQNKNFYKNYKLDLITGEEKTFFATKKPWVTSSGEVAGIIVNAIDIEQFQNVADIEVYRNDYVDLLLRKLQLLHFNTKSFLEETLFLSQSNSNNSKAHTEIYRFSKKLLADCEKILNSHGLIDRKTIPYTFNKINLRNLIKETIVQIYTEFYECLRVKFILQISNKIPKIIIGDIFRTKKLIQIIMKNLLKSNPKAIDRETICFLRLENNTKYNKNLIISFNFKLKLLGDSFSNNYPVKPSCNDKYPYIDVPKIKELVEELGGYLDISDGKDIYQIVIDLPFRLINFLQ